MGPLLFSKGTSNHGKGPVPGNLGEYIGVSVLKPFVDKDLILGETREFSVPGTQFRGRGIGRGPLHSRPKWWGRLVIELIYDTLDPDVAEWLKKNKPPPGLKWHQQLTENYGPR
jgi:hypothetical protein